MWLSWMVVNCMDGTNMSNLKNIKGNGDTLEYFGLIDWYDRFPKRHSISNIWIALSVVY